MEVTYQTQEIQNLHQKFSKVLEHLIWKLVYMQYVQVLKWNQ